MTQRTPGEESGSVPSRPRPGRPRRLRSLGAVGIGAALLLGTSGCTGQASSAATVGSVVITESTVLQDSTALSAAGAQAAGSEQAAGSPQTADSQGTPSAQTRLLDNRQVLTYRIRHQLLMEKMAALGLSVPTERVEQALANGAGAIAQQLGVPPELERQAVTDAFVVLTLAQQGAPVTDVQTTITEQSFATRAEAVQAMARAQADPATFSGQSENVTLISGAGRQLAPLGVFSSPAGSYLLVPQTGGDNWFVVGVGARTEVRQTDLATTLESLVSGQDQQAALWLSWTALASKVTDVPVQVNPRFGTWDPVSLQVVPTPAA